MINIEIYIDNVFDSITRHFQDDYDTIEIGDTVNINGINYTVISKEDNKLYLG